jgi:hypothetical protein
MTRHTPEDIADECERIQAMLDAYLQFSDETQGKIGGVWQLLVEHGLLTSPSTTPTIVLHATVAAAEHSTGVHVSGDRSHSNTRHSHLTF